MDIPVIKIEMVIIFPSNFAILSLIDAKVILLILR